MNHSYQTKFIATLIAASWLGRAAWGVPLNRTPPHLELEMSGWDYRALNERDQNWELSRGDDPLDEILALGKRNLDWIDLINRNRDAAHQLVLSDAASQPANPIDEPKFSSPTIIGTHFDEIKADCPQALCAVLMGNSELPKDAPVDDATFIAFARRVETVYESASRWRLEEPYLDYYASASVGDIAGYYHLSQERILPTELKDWSALSADAREKLSGWLVSECHNSAVSLKDCADELATATAREGGVTAFHDRYAAAAQAKYEGYFRIRNARPDVTWDSSQPNVLSVPFETPETDAIKVFLSSNIEDEWRLDAWNLRLNFMAPENANGGTPRVTFVPGATPHVNAVGGDVITMDANHPLTEYSTQWTIRHEFGHVMGFPDCYVEFYNEASAAMESYQLDITNLMCSRRGHFQQKHFDELKANYWHGG